MADTTPTLREAAQQALEALESLQGGCTDSGDGTTETITVWCPEVITALRAALAEQAAEQATHDNLRDTVGQAIHDVLTGWYETEDGTIGVDPFDSRNIDEIADAVIAVLPAAPAAEQAEPVAVPAGYALVRTPITDDMHVAAAKVLARAHGLEGTPQRMLDAMIAAAPPAPAPTWPEWAEQILKIVREYSGYDGYDDADGVDLPEEVREALEELTAQITRLEAKAPAPAADAMPAGWREVIADVAADISDHPSLACEKLRRLLAAPPAPARQEWQPIDTAPRAGNVIVAAPMEAGGYYVGEAWFSEDSDQWWPANVDPTDAHGSPIYPTLWQPLPAAPITAAPAEGGA